MMDQRLKTRYELHLPYEIHCVPNRTKVTGYTRNLSGRAVLFASDLPVAVGEKLEYSLFFPRVAGQRAEVRVHCTGRVIRTEPGEFAASVDAYEIVREMVASAAA